MICMAATIKQKKASKKYYEKHKEEIIEKVQKEQKTNKTEYNKDKREYYDKNEDYREYKKKYAKKYRKLEPVKSLARKDRKPMKKK